MAPSKYTSTTGFLPGTFFRGAKSIVMQISVVILTFLLFSDHISGGGAKVSEGEGETASGGTLLEESQNKGMVNHQHNENSFVFGRITQKI